MISKEEVLKIAKLARLQLTEKEVEKMQKEAESHSAEDQKKKELIEARNIADSLVYTAEKSLKDAGDKVPADVKSEVEDKINALREIQSTGSVEEVKTKTEELSSTLSKIGESMYKGQETPSSDQAPGSDGQTEAGGEEAKTDGASDKVEEGEVVKE